MTDKAVSFEKEPCIKKATKGIHGKKLESIYLSLEYEIMCFFMLSLMAIAFMLYQLIWALLFCIFTFVVYFDYIDQKARHGFKDVLENTIRKIAGNY